jgi:hypothetical protein
MIFFEQNELRSTARRLAEVLAEFRPWTLPNSVDAEDRGDAINGAIDSGLQVLIVPYRRVLEGLNLQKARSIVWYEMAMNLFMLDQASRRSWRLGQTCEVRLFFLGYRGTTAHRKLLNLGTKSGAAALFTGGTPDGELARTAGADKTTLARLSLGLEQTDDRALQAAFQRRGDELAARLKQGRQFIGVIDTLAARVQSRLVLQRADAARSVVVPAYSAGPEPVPVESLTELEPVESLTELVLGATATAGEAGPPLVVPLVPAMPRQLAITFGDPSVLGTQLRRQRKQRRAIAAGQLALF